MGCVLGAGLVSEPDGPPKPQSGRHLTVRACTASHSCGDWILCANSRVARGGLGERWAEMGWLKPPGHPRPQGQVGRGEGGHGGMPGLGTGGTGTPTQARVSKMQLGTQRWSCWQGWGSRPQQCDPKWAHREGSIQKLT